MLNMKKNIRQNILKRLSGLSKINREQQEQNLYEQLFLHPFWKNAKYIAMTLSRFPEIETKTIINRAWQEQKTVYVPKIINGKMIFVLFTRQTVCEANDFGILEPVYVVECHEVIDLVIVPGVAFHLPSRKRIGFGGGYYDKFLVTFKGKTLALALQEQIIEVDVFEEHDIAVQEIIIAKSGENYE